MSLAEEIAKLTNPVPEIIDSEDDINIETTAKLCEKTGDDDDDDVVIGQVSALRSRNAALLEEFDEKYVGKCLSRKNLDNDFKEGKSFGSDEDIYSDDDDNVLEESDDDDDDASEGSDDENVIEAFKSQMQDKLVTDNRCALNDDHSESLGDKSELEGEHAVTNDDDSDEDDEENSGDDMVQKFSSIGVNNDFEIEKGKAVRAQQELWNSLCVCRIKLQKLLVVTNKLPQFDSWNAFKQTPDASYSENLKKGYKSVKTLLNRLLDLQTELLSADPETVALVKDGVDTSVKNHDSDEEISSDNDEEKMIVSEKPTQPEQPLKRKLKDKEYESFLAKRHKSLIPFRNCVIQNWDEKTRLATGRMTQKSFSAFDQSALKQIEQILQDKNRLVKRTQLKRSIYHVLGKAEPEISEKKLYESGESVEKKTHDLLKDYDPEIFDDDDFYRQLLKDIIESKSVGIDPAILNKQQEIRRIRSKIRKKVDTKASKGRRIRYDIHQKLVNFMAPIMTYGMSDPVKDELFGSLFGQKNCVSRS